MKTLREKDGGAVLSGMAALCKRRAQRKGPLFHAKLSITLIGWAVSAFWAPWPLLGRDRFHDQCPLGIGIERRFKISNGLIDKAEHSVCVMRKPIFEHHVPNAAALARQ